MIKVRFYGWFNGNMSDHRIIVQRLDNKLIYAVDKKDVYRQGDDMVVDESNLYSYASDM